MKRLFSLIRWRRTPRYEEGQVLAESRGSRLVWCNGRVECLCVFACLAAYEPCEFAVVGVACDN